MNVKIVTTKYLNVILHSVRILNEYFLINNKIKRLFNQDKFFSAKGPTNGDPFKAPIELRTDKLVGEGEYQIGLWILMYCKTGCNDDKYRIILDVRDDNDFKLIYIKYDYKQNEYPLKKWTEKKENFNFKSGSIRVKKIKK